MVSGLTKTYQDFVLDHVSFTVPSGSIVGLIGENGAGKSTTINAALGLIQKEDGVVSILDKEELDEDIKEQIGVVFDGSNYPEILSPRKLNRVMKNIYRTWDDRLLILDEATSGLDPVVRDDILDMLLDFVQDEEHSILVSSHITSDAASKWNKNVITMPVSRNQIIGEKFLFYILLAVLGLVAALVPCAALTCFGMDITLHSLCLYGSIGISAILLAGGISLPCAYLFDPEKSQIVFMMSFMASTGIITGLVLLINLIFPVKENIPLAFNIVLMQ